MSAWLKRGAFSWCAKAPRLQPRLWLRYSTQVSAHKKEYEYVLGEHEMFGEEGISDYGPGRYYPIHLNDQLHQRYRVVDKLSYGSFSTAWLAIE